MGRAGLSWVSGGTLGKKWDQVVGRVKTCVRASGRFGQREMSMDMCQLVTKLAAERGEENPKGTWRQEGKEAELLRCNRDQRSVELKSGSLRLHRPRPMRQEPRLVTLGLRYDSFLTHI